MVEAARLKSCCSTEDRIMKRGKQVQQKALGQALACPFEEKMRA